MRGMNLTTAQGAQAAKEFADLCAAADSENRVGARLRNKDNDVNAVYRRMCQDPGAVDATGQALHLVETIEARLAMVVPRLT